jgi:hypothetical protein
MKLVFLQNQNYFFKNIFSFGNQLTKRGSFFCCQRNGFSFLLPYTNYQIVQPSLAFFILRLSSVEVEREMAEVLKWTVS